MRRIQTWYMSDNSFLKYLSVTYYLNETRQVAVCVCSTNWDVRRRDNTFIGQIEQKLMLVSGEISSWSDQTQRRSDQIKWNRCKHSIQYLLLSYLFHFIHYYCSFLSQSVTLLASSCFYCVFLFPCCISLLWDNKELNRFVICLTFPQYGTNR